MAIRVLQITDCIRPSSGVSEVIMNYYYSIDPEKVIFDFMVNEPVHPDILRKIEYKGSRVYTMPSLSIKHTFSYKRALETFFKEHAREYKIIHGHTSNAAAYYMPIAQKHGVPIRIIHSHNSRGGDSLFKCIRNRIMSDIAIASATERFACSKYASEYLYGDAGAFILKNAINISDYAFDLKKRLDIRRQLNLDDETVLIGHIGRFAKQKNHLFIINIAEKLLEEGFNAKIILIGDGPLRGIVEKAIKDKQLDEIFILTGAVSNANDYYSAMDAFILPSLYEGLPVVGIEAQTAGLPIAVSDKVSAEVMISENISRLPITDASAWTEWIQENSGCRRDNKIALQDAGYDISLEAKKLSSKYEELLSGL